MTLDEFFGLVPAPIDGRRVRRIELLGFEERGQVLTEAQIEQRRAARRLQLERHDGKAANRVKR